MDSFLQKQFLARKNPLKVHTAKTNVVMAVARKWSVWQLVAPVRNLLQAARKTVNKK